jgi:hypothetical protein
MLIAGSVKLQLCDLRAGDLLPVTGRLPCKGLVRAF